MQTQSERGIALVLALFLVAALSVLGASLMFLSQTETYSSMNYRMMSQSRYAGEAAIQKAANFLLDPTQYAIQVADLAAYNYQVSPVTLVANGKPVVLSASASVASNYAAGALTPGGVDVATAFANAAQGSLTAGYGTLTYNAYATLIAMQKIDSYSGAPVVLQTWQITGDGTITGARSATVEVSATIETPKMPAYGYAAFASSPDCDALKFGGNVKINGYDPAVIGGGGTPTVSSDGGDVGTNGNLDISGHVDVSDKLYSPRQGVGACSAGNVTALTATGKIAPANGEVHLPGFVAYPTPTIPAPSPLVAVASLDATTCANLNLTVGANAIAVKAGTAQCYVDTTTNTITINGTNAGNGTTLSLPTFNLAGGANIVLVAAPPTATIHNVYDINSISLNGGSSIGMSTTSATEGIIVNIAGENPDGSVITTPVDFTGGMTSTVDQSATGCPTCSKYDASLLQLVYGGTGELKLGGNAQFTAAVYAPNALATIVGTADIYGSVVASRVDDQGSGDIHYDRNLQGSVWVPGSTIIGTFTWKRY
ncbi:MAG: pilus assembly PilX N-terminal domain-containing protein [Acidobacteriia bacterium]|nr:pilus assembly PilX N-terminal domain-containing protein [Terriglobia bacterium]